MLGVVLGYEGDLRGALGRLEAALEAAGEDASRRAAAARYLALYLLWSRVRLEDALAYAELAVDLTSASPDRAQHSSSLSAKGFAEALLGRPTARDTLATAAGLELAAGWDPAAVTGSATFMAASLDVWTDRSEEGVRTLREFAEEWAQPHGGASAQVLVQIALGEYLIGRWPDAAEAAEDAYEAAMETGAADAACAHAVSTRARACRPGAGGGGPG